MKIYGGVTYNEDGISTSLRGMHLQTSLIQNINENIVSFGKVGYQRKVPVISSFAELLGPNALSEVRDTTVGRIRLTQRPLDLALTKKGYFQVQTPDGIRQTRDGRFKINKDGNLLTLENYKVLSSAGDPIKFKVIPDKANDVKVADDGTITSLDIKNNKVYEVGQLSIVASDGSILSDVGVKQGYTEDSNVTLQQEFYSVVPVRRNFEANRQLYIIQNDELSKTIQELGRA